VPQTRPAYVHKMRGMEATQVIQKDIKELTEMNIKQFIEATRQYLFDMASAQQPTLASIPVSGQR